jgi:UDP-3-O-[3-hydroxymyristoyl] glucosamine N-acyltransferase
MSTFHHSDSGPRVISLEELARLIGGRFFGPVEPVMISGIAPIALAQPGQITFLSDLKNVQKHVLELQVSRASAVIAPENIEGDIPLPKILCANAYAGFVGALNFFHPERRFPPGIHPTAFVHEEAVVHASASIGPMAVVEKGARIEAGVVLEAQVFVGQKARIGEGSRLHPHVTVGDHCEIGKRAIIHSGAVLGSDGFGFYRTREGHEKVPQVGIVELGDDVELGANVTIDRATMGKTCVGNGTKIDNMVHIAHNCQIGRRCIIVAQVGISGSTIIEDDVTLAGQVGTVGHVRIGKGTTVAARGVVTQDVEPNSFVSGFPLKPHSEEKRIMAALRKLPDLIKTVRELKELCDKKGKP